MGARSVEQISDNELVERFLKILKEEIYDKRYEIFKL